MASYINITGSQQDSFARYKMPVLQIRYRKNKTYLENLDDVCKALKRDRELILHYFSKALGCGKIDKTHMLNGIHSRDVLQGKLKTFIDKYVVCPCCSNPETTLYAFQSLEITCTACGNDSCLGESKMTSHIKKLIKKMK